MYEKLNYILMDFESDNSDLNYWYNVGVNDAKILIKKFTEEDWQKLFDDIDKKSINWKKRIAYCMDNNNDEHQLRLLEVLSKTSNQDLFRTVIDSLRNGFDINMLNNKEEIENKIKSFLLNSDYISQKIYLDFLKKKMMSQNNNLKIFTDNIENEAKEQIYKLLEQDAFKNSKIRIMPDVHAGKNCVIGFTGDLGEKVIPNIVGVDIGCGMLCIELGKIDIDYKKLDQFINKNIPNGKKINDSKVEDFDLSKLYCYGQLKNINLLENALGSLGGGNHFIEIDESKDGEKFLVIHTGSRNLGAQVANFYQNLADQICNHGILKLAEKIKKTIKEYKEQGREKEIQQELDNIRKEFNEYHETVPKEFAYLEGKYRDAYLHDMKICQEYAGLNRWTIAMKIINYMNFDIQNYFESVHNYISFDDNIVRKGAISARKGEKVIIPINMRDGCIIGIGKGNPDWNYSAPHGAGRIMSRRKAMEMIKLEEYKKSMENIYSTSVNEGTIDESPFAYKSMEEILEHIIPTVDVVKIVKPVYNFKASEISRVNIEEHLNTR